MRRGVLALLLVAVLAAVGMAESVPVQQQEDVDEGELRVDEEEAAAEPEAQPEQPQMDPRLTEEAFETIFSKLTARCLKEVQANPTDPSQVSDRCRNEVGHRIQRYLARLDAAEQEGDEPEKKQKKTRKNKGKKSRKLSRAERAAAEARQKEEEYQQTLQLIVGFVGTLVAVVIGATCFINRKLKAAGMYFPNPEEKASCCN